MPRPRGGPPTDLELLRRARLAEHEEERRRLVGEVVLRHLSLARSLAARYVGRGVALEDLEQVACTGLARAVARFDPDAGTPLDHLVVPSVLGELRRHLRDHSRTVRAPRPLADTAARATVAAARLRERLGRDPDEAEVARALGTDVEELRDALAATAPPLPLEAPASGDWPPARPPDASDPWELAEERAALAPLLRALPERDRRLLYLRFFRDLTQAEIGEELDVSQAQVSRRIDAVVARLRRESGTDAAGGR